MSIWGNPVMMGGSGGGGGSTNVLSGFNIPTSALGNNGSIYLRYRTPMPSEYTPAEYLEVTTAGPYIDTGVSNTSTAFVELDAQYTAQPGNNYGLFGAQASNEFTVNYYGGVYFANFGGAGRTVIPNSAVLDRHYFKAGETGVNIDNGAYTGPVNWSAALGRNYYLFAINYSGGILKTANARIYGCKLYNGSTLVREFVPCVRNSDSEPGMYDLVNSMFYDNDGTGAFSAGGQGTTASKPVLETYAKVNGAWQDLIGTDISDINLGS